MALGKYGKSRLVNMLVSAVFIVAGLYLAQVYIMEFPDPAMHWEGVAPLLVCFIYYVFS